MLFRSLSQQTQVEQERAQSQKDSAQQDRAEFRVERTISVASLRHKLVQKAVNAFHRASKFAASGAWQLGALELQKALAIDPNYAEAHANLGATYLHMGRIDEGATELRRAIALDPATSGYHANLAVALAQLGKNDDAKTEAMAALAIDSTNPEAHYLLGMLIGSQPREYRNAIPHLEYSARFIPEGHQSLAHLYELMGEPDRAEDERSLYKKALERSKPQRGKPELRKEAR